MRPHLSLAPALVALTLSATLLAACGPPPDVAPTPAGPLPTPGAQDMPASPGAGQAAPSPNLPGSDHPADQPTDCEGEPTAEQMLALVQADLGDGDVEVDVAEGPLCADQWQFLILTVPDRDPLQVVTSGAADELTLVTAGTDVCTVEVRVHAPPGIRSVAGCGG